MSRASGPKKPAASPDGSPRRRPSRRGGTDKSRVTEVQDPLIAGDERKPAKRLDTADASIDEAGEVRRRDDDVDLLH